MTDGSVMYQSEETMPKIVDKKKKEAVIGQAALRTFLKKGYHRTKMADIAQAAGVGKGTLYEYFKNKSEILRFVFGQYFVDFKEGALHATSNAKDPRERLLALIGFTLGHLADWEDHCAVYIDYLSVARTDNELQGITEEIYREASQLFSQLIQECQDTGELRNDIDPTAIAELLISLFDGIILRGIYSKRQCNLDELRETFIKLFEEGMRPKP